MSEQKPNGVSCQNATCNRTPLFQLWLYRETECVLYIDWMETELVCLLVCMCVYLWQLVQLNRLSRKKVPQAVCMYCRCSWRSEDYIGNRGQSKQCTLLTAHPRAYTYSRLAKWHTLASSILHQLLHRCIVCYMNKCWNWVLRKTLNIKTAPGRVIQWICSIVKNVESNLQWCHRQLGQTHSIFADNEPVWNETDDL